MKPTTDMSTHSGRPAKGRSTDEHAMAEAIKVLETNRVMAISTVRPDGWPQTTIVGYANQGLTVYFMILRSSQKFANIQRDDRVSIAVGQEPAELHQAKAVFAGAHALEIKNSADRARVWKLLELRHPNLDAFDLPKRSDAAVMRADCRHVSLADYTKGLGHTEAFTVMDAPTG